MTTIVIGMGNPLRSDDGIGVEVARRVAKQLPPDSGIAVRELYAGGMQLMEAMCGYDRAIIIDAMSPSAHRPGTIYGLGVGQGFPTRNTCSSHDASLAVALELGTWAGLRLPSRISILAIQAGDVTSFGEHLTDEVARAVPAAVASVLQELRTELQAGEAA